MSLIGSHCRELLSDKGALLVLLIAPILYAFFYPLPYQQEQLYDLPMGVVDLDRSAHSRELIRLWQSAPQVQVQAFTHAGDAMHAMAEGHIIAWAVIPEGWQRRLIQQENAALQLGTSGVNVLASSQLMGALNGATQSFNQGIKVERLSALGVAANQIEMAQQPVALSSVPLYNPSQGYGHYVVPAVMVMVLQQSLWIGQSLLLGRRSERGVLWGSWRDVGVDWLLFSLIALWNSLFLFSWLLNWQGYSLIGEWWPLLLFSSLFAAAIAASGLLLASAFGYREQGMQWLLALAVPLFFVSGYPLPVEALPEWVQAGRWLIPSTAGMAGFMAINQMGAGLGDLTQPMFWLLVLTLLSLLGVWFRVAKGRMFDEAQI